MLKLEVIKPISRFSNKLSFIISSSSYSCGGVRRRIARSLGHIRPPIPKKVPFVVSAHGSSWLDPYHWMSDVHDPDLVHHLQLENRYASAFMADTKGQQRQLLDEMRSRIPPKISTPPEKWGPWLYFQYIPEEKEYPVFCRKWAGHDSFWNSLLDFSNKPRMDQVLLDWNEFAEQHGYTHIGTCRVSPNHRFLAYTVDTTGDENFVLQVKDLKTGCALRGIRIDRVVSVAWAKDSSCLLYTVCDETLRPSRVYRKKLSSNMEDLMLYEEHDTSCCVDIATTKDGKFITINSNSRSSSEVFVMDAENLQYGFYPVWKRHSGMQCFLEHNDGYFYILTNASEHSVKDTGGFYLAKSNVKNFQLDKWEDFILPGVNASFQDMDMFHGHLVLFILKEGAPKLCSIDMPLTTNEAVAIDDLHPWFFPLPTSICCISPGSNPDFMTTSYRVVISSPVMPDITVDYDMVGKTYKVVHQEGVLPLSEAATNCNIDASLNCHVEHDSENLGNMELVTEMPNLSGKYICERKEVISHDGVSVPLTILYSNVRCATKPPSLLHGYGAYGEVLDKSWCPHRISLLDRGWTLAFADVRGGGGGGNSWHQSGTRLNKLNSIHDFAACAKYLMCEGYAHEHGLCAIGSSAGGLLVAATINMYPNLFGAAILKVPFLDICNTLLDSSLPLTKLDYEEFGDPRIESDFKMLRAYSPYDNISQICPPPMLVKAAFNDSRVGVWEAAKWVARLRDRSCFSCSQFVVLKTNMDAGHFGEGGRYQECEEFAYEYAFLIKVMGKLNDTIS